MNGKLSIGSGEEWGRVRLEREAEARSSQASKLYGIRASYFMTCTLGSHSRILSKQDSDM